jgi:hypothetical protein
LFPSATKDEDKYAYNEADQMTEAKMLKETELASLVYTRDNDGQLKKTTSKGLPGSEITETPTTKTTVSRNRLRNTNTTRRTTRRRSAPEPTNTTKPTSAKPAPA